MLTTEQITQIADQLLTANKTRKPIPLLTQTFPQMQVEDSYAVQRLWAQRNQEAGRKLVGRKIGLTSKVMQDATGITEPDYGVIFDDMVFESGCDLSWNRYTHPRIEVELAFVLNRDIHGPNATIFDVLDASKWVVPALEILDSHIEMEGRTIVDTISDNAAMGAMVVGGRPMRVTDIDLRWVSALLYRNQNIEESGVSGAVLGHPANGVAWLANKFAAHDDYLKAGEIILAGSFTRPLWVNQGDTILVDYKEMGTVSCHFH